MDMDCCERCGDLCRTQIGLKSVTKSGLWCVNCFLEVVKKIILKTKSCPICQNPPISSMIHNDNCMIYMMTCKEEDEYAKTT